MKRPTTANASCISRLTSCIDKSIAFQRRSQLLGNSPKSGNSSFDLQIPDRHVHDSYEAVKIESETSFPQSTRQRLNKSLCGSWMTRDSSVSIQNLCLGGSSAETTPKFDNELIVKLVRNAGSQPVTVRSRLSRSSRVSSVRPKTRQQLSTSIQRLHSGSRYGSRSRTAKFARQQEAKKAAVDPQERTLHKILSQIYNRERANQILLLDEPDPEREAIKVDELKLYQKQAEHVAPWEDESQQFKFLEEHDQAREREQKKHVEREKGVFKNPLIAGSLVNPKRSSSRRRVKKSRLKPTDFEFSPRTRQFCV